MTGMDAHRKLGPDTPLFSAYGRPVLSARQVKAAVDAHQIYLDERLQTVRPRQGTISVRNVVAWLRSGCPPGDLARLIIPHKLAALSVTPASPRSGPPSLSPRARERAALRSDPVPPPEPDPESPPTFLDRVRDMAAEPWAWFGAWAIYCGLGFATAMFVKGNPELTFWGIAGAAVFALLAGAFFVLSAAGMAGALMGRGSNVVWDGLVTTALVLGTGWLATLSYSDAYRHLQLNQLAPLATLVERCMEGGIQREPYRVGAVCRDGWRSRATGQGACSHHQGVDHWIYPTKQTRTIQECRQRASDTSWLYYYSDSAR